jgi:hypothetical protein
VHERLVSAAGRGIRVRRLGGDRAGEIRLTRFLRNPSVTPQEMVAGAAERVAERCADRHVLAIQDSTAAKSKGRGGLYLHVCLAVDADDGAILGLAHGQILKRAEGRKVQRRGLPTSQKESQRWLDGADAAARAGAPARKGACAPSSTPSRRTTFPSSRPSAPSSRASPNGKRTRTPRRSPAYASRVCARLGGWTGYYGKPGPVVTPEGWFQFQAAMPSLRAMKAKHNV